MVVLQSWTNSVKVVAGLCSGRSATSSGDLCEAVHIMAEKVTGMDIEVEEMSVVKVDKDTVMDIKGEEIPVAQVENETAIDIKEEYISGDGTFRRIKAEEDEVSYICVCVSPLLDTFQEYPIMLGTVCYLRLSLCLSVCLSVRLSVCLSMLHWQTLHAGNSTVGGA
jgi:hypothetical protein